MHELEKFMAYYRIHSGGDPRRLLERVVTAFARLPYENITKIIKKTEVLDCERARRRPEEVIDDHIAWGAGGTCFSLTSALAQLVRDLGWEAEYILADRRYGQDTHCALLVWIKGVANLLDPGYLIVHPIPLKAGKEQHIETGFNDLVLAPENDSDKVSLYTLRGNKKTYRLTYRTLPVDPGVFGKAWDASFQWEMMKYPLLTRTEGSRQIYVKGSRIQISGRESTESRRIPAEDLIGRISSAFGIHASLVEQALSILKGKGDFAASKR
jgi:arylamine N-acetyltransferase